MTRDRSDGAATTAMDGDIAARLAAVERAVGDTPEGTEPPTTSEATERLAAAEERLDAVEDQLAELEAATQAIRGYVGAVRAVNERVEARADSALAVVEALAAAADGETLDEAADPDVLAAARDTLPSDSRRTGSTDNIPTDPVSDGTASSDSVVDDDCASLSERLRDAL